MDRRANHLLANQNRSPSNTTFLSTMSSASANPACGPALSLCSVTHDKLLHAVIVLSVLTGILLTVSFALLLLLCFRLRHSREGPISVEEGSSTGTAESVVKRPKKPNTIKIEEVTVLASPRELGPSSSSESQLEVKGAVEENRVLSRVSSVASIRAFSGEEQPQCPCLRLEPAAISYGSQSRSSPAPSLAILSVDDFNQGQDDEFHPEVRALVEEGSFTKEAVRRLKPVPPKVGTVIPDYNPVLDEARPVTMDEYLLNYRILFVIDDSGSMVQHWNETRNALLEIADYALTYHSNAVDIRFFNSRHRNWGVQGTNQVMNIFASVSPSGGTPTGRVLREILDERLDRLDNAQRNGLYSSERPLEIIVLTDGVPNSDSPPAPVIEDAAARMKNTGHHQNWISIQFVQVGDNPQAEPTLLSLIDCANNNHMVDTISYSLYKDEGGGKLTPEILERIVLGGLHPNLRSYFNQYRRKLYERTSQVIY